MTIVVCEEAEWGSFRALNKVRSYNFLELLRKHRLKRGRPAGSVVLRVTGRSCAYLWAFDGQTVPVRPPVL